MLMLIIHAVDVMPWP